MIYLVGELNPVGETVLNAAGTHFSVSRKSAITDYMTEKDAAVAAASKKAAENPGKQFAVFEVVEIFETTTPKVLRKRLNEQGETVLVE